MSVVRMHASGSAIGLVLAPFTGGLSVLVLTVAGVISVP